MTVSERAKYDEDKRLREEEEERAARRLAAQMNLVRPRTAAELRNRYTLTKVKSTAHGKKIMHPSWNTQRPR